MVAPQSAGEWWTRLTRALWAIHVHWEAPMALKDRRHWEATLNVAYAALLLAAAGLVLRDMLHVAAFPLTVSAFTVTLGLLKVARVNINCPDNNFDDEESEPDERTRS